jgi:hypothetical protein
MTAAWMNHLWQSTVFAIAAGLLTLILRNNRAQVRYRLWFVASVKFLVPFSWLIASGTYLDRVPAAQTIAARISTPSIPMAQFTPATWLWAPQTGAAPPSSAFGRLDSWGWD